MLTYIIIFSILSYLIGSFSSAVWFGRWFWNTDVREFGSKMQVLQILLEF